MNSCACNVPRDDSPFDQHFDGAAVLDDQELRGLALFVGKGGCVNCHDGPEFTKAATHLQPEAQEEGLVERMLMAQGSIRPALYDNGFYNIGVTPTVQFQGVGGKDPFNNPLSFTRQFLEKTPFKTTVAGQNFKDKFKVDPCTFEILVLGPPETCDPNAELVALKASGPQNERVAVDGAIKTPTLRNAGLTAPYFHSGGYATLRRVVEFYDRGGNRRGNNNPNEVLQDSTGTGPLGRSNPVQNQHVGSNSDPDIVPLELIVDPGQGIDEIGDLVAFILSLSDHRVACQSGVFDHPSITLFNGHTDVGPGPHAEDETFVLPAVGQEGLSDPECLTNSGDLFIP
jgi:cytochrome c peroxidase